MLTASEKTRQWRKKNPEKHRAHNKKYRERHPEKVENKNKKWRKANPEKVRAYVRKANKKYYQRHRKQELARNKKWREQNPNYFKKWARNNKERRAATCRKSEYGILPHEYDTKLKKQKGLCAICKRKMKRPDVDHNHRTGEVRDLLCRKCNTILGLAGESIRVLKRAIQYLRRHNVVGNKS